MLIQKFGSLDRTSLPIVFGPQDSLNDRDNIPFIMQAKTDLFRDDVHEASVARVQ